MKIREDSKKIYTFFFLILILHLCVDVCAAELSRHRLEKRVLSF